MALLQSQAVDLSPSSGGITSHTYAVGFPPPLILLISFHPTDTPLNSATSAAASSSGLPDFAAVAAAAHAEARAAITDAGASSAVEAPAATLSASRVAITAKLPAGLRPPPPGIRAPPGVKRKAPTEASTETKVSAADPTIRPDTQTNGEQRPDKTIQNTGPSENASLDKDTAAAAGDLGDWEEVTEKVVESPAAVSSSLTRVKFGGSSLVVGSKVRIDDNAKPQKDVNTSEETSDDEELTFKKKKKIF